MSIARQTGDTASNAVATNTLSFAAYSATAGRDVAVVVAMANTGASVGTITDTAGNSYSLKSSASNTGIRVEVWEAHNITANASNVILITLASAATSLMAAAYEEYSGVSAVGNTTSNSTGADTFPRVSVAAQDGNNYIVGGLGFVCAGTETISAIFGNVTRSLVPALASVGVALVDNTQTCDGTMATEVSVSASVTWAAAGLELRSGGSAVTAASYAETTAPSLQVAQDTRYLRVTAPLGGGGSIAPPSGDGQFWPPPIAQQGG